MKEISKIIQSLYGRASCGVYAQRWLAPSVPAVIVEGLCLRALRDLFFNELTHDENCRHTRDNAATHAKYLASRDVVAPPP